MEARAGLEVWERCGRCDFGNCVAVAHGIGFAPGARGEPGDILPRYAQRTIPKPADRPAAVVKRETLHVDIAAHASLCTASTKRSVRQRTYVNPWITSTLVGAA